VLHAATRPGDPMLLVVILVVAVMVEQASIWLGGTHCHATSDYMLTACSSLNSVFYYVPWFYSCLLSTQRLGLSRQATPLAAGVMLHGFCSVYELQGPSFGFWRWPDAASRAVAEGDFLTTYRGFLGGTVVVDGVGGEPPVLRTHPHAYHALETRWSSAPVMAPLYHVAMGVGFAMALSLTGPFDLTQRVPLWRWVVTVVLTGPIALLFDLPPRFAERMDVGRSTVAPLLIVLTAILPPLIWPATKTNSVAVAASASTQPDHLLFAVPLLNHLYFATFSWRHELWSPHPELYPVVLAFTAASLAAHRRACLLPRAVEPKGKRE